MFFKSRCESQVADSFCPSHFYTVIRARAPGEVGVETRSTVSFFIVVKAGGGCLSCIVVKHSFALSLGVCTLALTVESPTGCASWCAALFVFVFLSPLSSPSHKHTDSHLSRLHTQNSLSLSLSHARTSHAPTPLHAAKALTPPPPQLAHEQACWYRGELRFLGGCVFPPPPPPPPPPPRPPPLRPPPLPPLSPPAPRPPCTLPPASVGTCTQEGFL